MGKGTRKKTVWRTFSFENGNCNENDASPANQNENGQENIPTSNDTNVKPVSNWRYRRFYSNGTDNLSSENESHDDDLQKSKELNVEQLKNTNGYHNNNNYGYRHQYHHHYNRPHYKRWPLLDQQYARDGFRENVNSGTENVGENDNNINNEDDSNRIQSNHYTRSYRTPFHRHFNGGYKRWENRYYHPNSSIGNYYNRGFRRSYFSHSDKQYAAFTKNNDHYYNKNCLTENGVNTRDGDKQNDGSFGHQNGKQASIKINEDEYTRISTPRSEVLFKKGYLMRAKKYSESTTPPTTEATTTATTTATSSINPPTSSNDSGSVSVVSNEETASYYSIHSMSPENSAFVNGNICNDGTSISYSNENYNGDVPLVFSSGFYDNNGYFYVNPYIPSHYDQYNRPIGLIPFDNTTPANGPRSTSPATTINPKSIKNDHLNDFNNQHSEDISTSSLSENASINNDSVTPQSPLTPPPSPLSPTDPNSSDDNNINFVENKNETTTNVDQPTPAPAPNTNGEKTLNENNDNEVEPKPAEDMQNQLNETDVIEPSEDNYSMPYYPPFIFVPPIPFVPGGHIPGPGIYQKRNRYHRRYSYHRHNHFRKYNRLYQYNDKFYVPTNWSEAPDETTYNVVQDSSATSDAEPATDVEKSSDIIASPTLEQCDIILKNSKLNLNVSEFVPQTKRNAKISVCQMVPSPINIQPSQLNVNVPEFLPKNYKPLAQFQTNDDISNTIPKCDETEDNKSNSIADKTFNQSAAESKENYENQKLDEITNSTNLDNNSQNEQVQKSITNCATNGSKDGVENYNKNKPSTVRTLSELLKTNSNTKTLITNENSFVDRSELNKSISDTKSSIKQQNSRMNLKADLGNKHRNKVWYNRNSSADYKSNYNTNNDLNINTNRNNNYDNNSRMIKSAYPAINGHHQHHAKLTDINNNNNSSTAIAIPTKVLGQNAMKPLSNKGFSYAQMVVPTKSESIQSANNQTPFKLKPAKKITNVNNNKINLKPTKTEENPSIQMKQSTNGSVEWFTVGAKGKKQALLNDKPNFVEFTTKLLQENTSTEEQVNSVAEELQLDIKNDSDLVMDIMDSLALSRIKTATNQALNTGKKKATITKTLKKKSPKDKTIKESKRSRSQKFEIIEPNFENGSKQIAITGDVQAMKSKEIEAIDENSQINDDEEFTFDPNVFTAPLNFKTDMTPENVQNIGNSCTALRLSANKSIRSLMNTFDIYQSDLNVSAENQKLQRAEEMVNKVLESLKKIETTGDDCSPNKAIPTDSFDSMQQIQPNNEITSDDDDDVNSSHSSASSISFEVNAKPYQNAYSSNHFLGHFFGDKNDKRDQVVHSANLSSSDQNNYTNTNAEQLNDFNVTNSESTPNVTDSVIVKNVENLNFACDILSVVSQLALSSSESKILISNNESDHEQAPEAFDDRRIKPRVDSKLNENETDLETDMIHSENITELKFSQKSAHSISDSPSNVRDEPVVVIENIKPVVVPSIDSMVETHESVQNEQKTVTKPNYQIPNKQRPWLCIVDTQMLEKQKKMQNTFPITTAVSMWLNQAQKEKTPEPILRLPNDLNRNGFFGTKRTKTISQTSQSTATSVGTDQYYHVDNYSSDETASLTSERDEKDKIDLTCIVDDDEEDDIMNYWESDSQSTTPKTTTAYQSVYGNSINYEKLLSNKNELLCNNIIDFDHVEEMAGTYPQTEATAKKQGPQTKLGTGEDYFKPAPEICCTIM